MKMGLIGFTIYHLVCWVPRRTSDDRDYINWFKQQLARFTERSQPETGGGESWGKTTLVVHGL